MLLDWRKRKSQMINEEGHEREMGPVGKDEGGGKSVE